MTSLSSPAMNENLGSQNGWYSLLLKLKIIRRDIAHTELIQTCQQTNSYTANQKRIRNKLIRKYRNIKQHTLTYRIKCLKQKLKTTSWRLNYQKKVSECSESTNYFLPIPDQYTDNSEQVIQK